MGSVELPPLSVKAACWAAGLLLAWLGLRWFERASLFIPSRQLAGTPADSGFPYEELRLTAADGTRLHAWLVPGPEGGRTVVFFHGNAGNISHRMEKLRLLRGLGLSVLLFDYRGYGQSEGRPGERGTYADGLAAVEHLLAGRKLPAGRLVYYGESLGCAVALETALARPPGALILESPFTSTAEMGRRLLPFLPARLLVRHRYDNLAKIGALKAPLLILHSPDDEIVPYAMGRALFAAAPEPKAFAELRGDHNGGFLDTPDYARALREFLAAR